MDKEAVGKFGGYTLSEIEGLVGQSEEREESIDSITGDEATSSLILKDLAKAYRAALAQQPAAQAAGLTDVVSLLREIRPQFGAPGTRDVDVRAQQERIDAAIALLSRAAPSGEPVAYVECRECGRCGHTGINDAHSQDECCSNCDWTGPAPKEDVCPGCAQTGTMRAACPKCGSVYRLLCETTVGTAPQPSAQQADPLYAIGNYELQQPEPPAEQAAEEARGVGEIGHQDARFAIDGAIAFGRMGIKEPPQGHWLAEYWQIGKQLAELGKESAWDNVTPLATPATGAGQIEGWLVSYEGGVKGVCRSRRAAMELAGEQGIVEALTRAAPQAATGAQGLTSADVEHIRKLIEVARMPNAESVADDHNAAVRHLRALAASKEA